jgi:hypothetical protein
MSAYAMQERDKIPKEVPDESSNLWVYRLSDEERLMLAAFVFMQSGVTKPSARKR